MATLEATGTPQPLGDVRKEEPTKRKGGRKAVLTDEERARRVRERAVAYYWATAERRHAYAKDYRESEHGNAKRLEYKRATYSTAARSEDYQKNRDREQARRKAYYQTHRAEEIQKATERRARKTNGRARRG